MVQRKFFAVSAGALVLALIGSLGAPRSLAATGVKMERIAAGLRCASSSSINGRRGRPPWFLPKAITMPGYVFVPGRGILGESCDLPTSACSNEYRDIPKANEIGQSLPRSADSKPGQLESMPA
jgi:hypothetical protein